MDPKPCQLTGNPLELNFEPQHPNYSRQGSTTDDPLKPQSPHPTSRLQFLSTIRQHLVSPPLRTGDETRCALTFATRVHDLNLACATANPGYSFLPDA